MIEYTTGNLLDADTQALVNTVNTVGVMGKGIALQFKEQFPQNFKTYAAACKNKELAPGKLLVTREHLLDGEKIIVNFPTKTEWFRKSSYKYIEAGLVALVEAIKEHEIKSIALPPLGCGNGGLDWKKVRPMIEKALEGLDARVVVYEPSASVKAILRDQQPREVKLTPARAMLLYALYNYERQGERANVFVANKLAYFLQLLGEDLRLKFVPYHYGPYSVQVGHVLYALNGSYLKGLEQNQALPFEELQLDHSRWNEVNEYVSKHLDAAQKQRLDTLMRLIDGFEGAYALELLASVAFIRQEKPRADVADVIERMIEWSERKEKLADRYAVKVSVEHLDHFQGKLMIQ